MHTRSIFAWLDAPSAERGIHFALAEDDWEFWSYAQLAGLARKIARGLVEAGIQHGDIVTLVAASRPDFVAGLFGTLLAGAIPSPVPPPAAYQETATFVTQLRWIFKTARPKLVVADAALAGRIAEFAREGGIPVEDFAGLAASAGGREDRADRAAPPLVLLQFTSGSSGSIRGVRLPALALETNLAAIGDWLNWGSGDPFASWLPLHHDMGLIIGLLGPIFHQSDLWLMAPEQFVRNPLRYLRCFGLRGARLSATAPLGLDVILRRVRPEALDGFDFSQWRALIIGAERIEAGKLEAFHARLAPFGLRRDSLLPGYGMAEATVAVSGLPLGEGWQAVSVEPASLALGETAAFVPDGEGLRIVGCGRPLNDISVAVMDGDRRLPDGAVGEIVVQGGSVAAGYAGGAELASSTEFAGDTLRTGDAGFLLEGQIFVLGRLGDSMKIHGRTVFGEDIELALSGIGIPRHRQVALLGVRGGEPVAVLLFRDFRAIWLPEIEEIVRTYAGPVELTVIDTAILSRTTSGKPRRRHLWRAYLDGTLPGTIVAVKPPADLTADPSP